MQILGPIILGFCLFLGLFLGFYYSSYTSEVTKRRTLNLQMDSYMEGRQRQQEDQEIIIMNLSNNRAGRKNKEETLLDES